MAEGLLGGILGEDEKPEVEATETLASADAFAAAVAAKLAGNEPEVARRTADFLIDQSQLLKVQKKHLEDEHALRLAHLRNQLREERVRRFGLRLRVGFQLFIALAATAIGIGAAILIHDAFTSRRVVIEPFHSPPGFPTRGIDGEVVASGLLDELSRLQAAARSATVGRTLEGAWAGNIKLDLPETGISIGEMSRILKDRFGHDVHIEGDLRETPTGGLALTVRGNGVPPKSFVGEITDLEKLTVGAAEYVYAKSQPVLWATYLSVVGRNEESIAFCRSTLASADPADRPHLLNSWGLALQNVGGSNLEALELFRAAVKLQPDYWVAHGNAQNALVVLGDEEGAWRDSENMRKIAGGRPGRAREDNYQNADLLSWNLPAWLEASVANADANAGFGNGVTTAGLMVADIQARRHDPQAAELALETTPEDPHDAAIAAVMHFVHGRILAEAGNATQAAAEMEAFGSAFADPSVSTSYPGYNCWIAPAEEAAGHPDKANAVLKTAGRFVDCFRFRADILDGRGDWAGAQKAYADAVALAPDLPAAYYSWGQALAKHGDLDGATAKLKEANQKGPHWADPIKAWGDVLVRQGNTKAALAKYDEALKYAANWAALKEAREAAKVKR
jgi:tetratricopeptide (TPR) repeat protein